ENGGNDELAHDLAGAGKTRGQHFAQRQQGDDDQPGHDQRLAQRAERLAAAPPCRDLFRLRGRALHRRATTTPAASAASTIAPLAKFWYSNGSPAKKMTFAIRVRISAPNTDPSAPPVAPDRAVPPSTTALIELRVKACPMSGSPVAVPPVRQNAASAANSPHRV